MILLRQRPQASPSVEPPKLLTTSPNTADISLPTLLMFTRQSIAAARNLGSIYQTSGLPHLAWEAHQDTQDIFHSIRVSAPTALRDVIPALLLELPTAEKELAYCRMLIAYVEYNIAVLWHSRCRLFEGICSLNIHAVKDIICSYFVKIIFC